MITTPYAPVVALSQMLDRLVDESVGGAHFRTLWSRSGYGSGSPAPQPLPHDVYATDEQAVIVAAAPGMRPEELELTVHQNTVTLAGAINETGDAEETKGATWYVRELWTGRFRRSVTLPFAVDADQAEAHFEQGMLWITLPKAETAKPKKIAIGGQQHQAIEAGHSSS